MKTVTICGSTRFEDEMKLCMKLLTLQGVLVISMSSYPSENAGTKDWFKESQKELLDLVHLEKVSRADCVLVVDTYIGDEPFDQERPYCGYSTAKELIWASLHGIPVAFLHDFLSGAGSVEQAMQDLVDALVDGEVLTPEVTSLLPLLDHALGRKATADAAEDTRRDVMHAALSSIAERRRPEEALDAPEVAADALTFLHLEVMPADLRTKYLLMMDPNSSAHDREVVGG